MWMICLIKRKIEKLQKFLNKITHREKIFKKKYDLINYLERIKS
jgi:hypothetical protein